MTLAVKERASGRRARVSLSFAGYGAALGASAVAVVVAGSAVETATRVVYAEVTLFRTLQLVVAVAVLGTLAHFLRTSEGSWPTPRSARAVAAQVRRVGTLARSIPTWFLLGEVIVLAAGLRIALNRAATLPRVFGDELIYVSLAKSIATSGQIAIRGTETFDYGVLYPVVISLAYLIFDDGYTAFEAIKIANAIFMALAAIPTYLLARKLVGKWWALGCATLAAIAPATAYSALVMTESMFYPLFVLFTYALVSALEKPTLSRQTAVVVALLTMFAIRQQAVALALAAVTAVLVFAIVRRSVRANLRLFSPLLLELGFVAGAAQVLAISVDTSSGSLGAYSVLARPYSPVDVAAWMVRHVAVIALSVGVIAFCAFVVVIGQLVRRSSPSRELAFGAATMSILSWTLASVAVLSASPWGLERMHERNLFFVLPLVLVAMAYWLDTGLPRPRALAVGSASMVIAAPFLLTGDMLHFPTLDAPTLLPWAEMWSTMELEFVPAVRVVGAAAALGAICFLTVRTRFVPILSVVLAFLVVASAVDWESPVSRSTAQRLRWVDAALPEDASAAVVNVNLPVENCGVTASPASQRWLAVLTEFFNKSVGRVGYVHEPLGLDFLGYATPMRIRTDGTLMEGTEPFPARYVVVPSSIRLVGTPVDRLDARIVLGDPGSLTLWRTPGTIRLKGQRHSSRPGPHC